jgi:thiamine-phosphate pyrophosphorylase
MRPASRDDLLMSTTPDGARLRAALASAHVYLIFTPELCGARDPLEVLRAAWPWVDLVQVRPKPRESGLDPLRGSNPSALVSEARASYDWCRRVLELARELERLVPVIVPVIVNDRVDVAASLRGEGLAGVHLGQDDFPAALAREQLGPDVLIGLSTHSPAQVARAEDEPVDYLGFGPFRATATKGYARGLGSEACWLPQEASPRPVFPIGGIDVANAGELERIGRAAVGSAILSAEDPAAAARAIREALLEA